MPENEKKTPVRKPRAAKPKTAEAAAAKPAVKKKAAPKKKATVTSITKKFTHEEIAVVAHRLWAERGYEHGHDAEDWVRAEQLLRGKAS